MTPLSLSITNFRSFKQRSTFRFPQGPGLYFMWGENRIEPRLGPNGAGKSTIWKALTWLFYGKTNEGLKAGDAANWDAGTGTVVELEYVDEDGGVNTLIRTWSPNSWKLKDSAGSVHDLAKDPSNPVLNWLRLDFQPFLSCVLMAQGMPMFLDMERSAQAALFAQIMDLDRWLARSERAAALASDLDRKVRSLELQRASAQATIDAVSQSTPTEARDEWQRGREIRLQNLEQEYTILIDRERSLQAKLAARSAEARAAEKDVRDANKAYADAHDAVQRLSTVPHHSAEVSKHVCPSCGQGISDRLHEALDVEKRAARALTDARRAMEAAQQAERYAQRDIDSVNAVLDDLEARERDILAEINPFTNALEQNRKQLLEAQDLLADVEARLDEERTRQSMASYWARLYKELRLSLISEALEQLEIEVNSCVVQKGLVGWELRFDVDRETARGTIQRGFTVSVKSPGNSRAVPWSAWSGGEAQRLRIATAEGLSNLIRARTGTLIPVEVWDEPTQHMSAEGVSDLLDSLKQRAVDEGRQIWIVDHRTLGYSDFDGEVGVVKTRDGSQIVHEARYMSFDRHCNDTGQPPTPYPDDRALSNVVRRRTSSR